MLFMSRNKELLIEAIFQTKAQLLESFYKSRKISLKNIISLICVWDTGLLHLRRKQHKYFKNS